MNIENTIIKPERIFDDVVPAKRSLRSLLSPKLNAWQKSTFCGGIVFFVLTLLLAIAFNISPNDDIAHLAMVALLIMYAFFFAYQLTLIAPELRKISGAERTLLESTINQFSDDIKRVNWIAKNFDEIDIKFAQKRLSLTREQLQHRISLIVGVIEKVGLVPIGVSAYITIAKLRTEETNLDFSAMEWVGMGLAFLYFFAIVLHQITYDFQRHELILETALETKQKQKQNKDKTN